MQIYKSESSVFTFQVKSGNKFVLVKLKHKKLLISETVEILDEKDIKIEKSCLICIKQKYYLGNNMKIFNDLLKVCFSEQFQQQQYRFKEFLSQENILLSHSGNFIVVYYNNAQYLINIQNLILQHCDLTKTILISHLEQPVLTLSYVEQESLQFILELKLKQKEFPIITAQQGNNKTFSIKATQLFLQENNDQLVQYLQIQDNQSSQIYINDDKMIITIQSFSFAITIQNIKNIYYSNSNQHQIILQFQCNSKFFIQFEQLQYADLFFIEFLSQQAKYGVQASVKYLTLQEQYNIYFYDMISRENFINSKLSSENQFNTEQMYLSLGYVYANFSNTLPCVSKNIILLRNLMQYVTQSTKIQDISLLLSLFSYLISSRTLYESLLIENISFFQKFLKYIVQEEETSLQNSISCIIRQLFSYQWIPSILQTGQSYQGMNISYVIDYNYLMFFNLAKINVSTVKEQYKQSSKTLARIGIHNKYQQGQNYLQSRIKIDVKMRCELIQSKSQIIQILGSKVLNLEKLDNVQQMLIIGALSDILVTQTHYNKNSSLVIKNDQQILRKQLFYLIFENHKFFINMTSSSLQLFSISCSLLLKQFFQENLVENNLKNIVCEYYLVSGIFLQHLQIILQNSNDILSQVLWSLVITSYIQNKNMQNVIKRIFPSSLTSKILQEKKISYNYLNISQLFNQQCSYLCDLRQILYTPSYSVQLVWDLQIAQGVQKQLSQFFKKYQDKKSLNPELLFNYDQVSISYRNYSNRDLSEFDIDVQGIILSQLITFEPEYSRNFIGTDNQDYFTSSRQNRPYQQLKYILNQLKPQDIADKLYYSYAQEIYDHRFKQALIYVINTLYLQFDLKFSYLLEFLNDTMEQINQNHFGLVIYQLYLLECIGYNACIQDVLKRNNFIVIGKSSLSTRISLQILSQSQNLIENERISLKPNIFLLFDATYYNLFQISLRIITTSLYYIKTYQNTQESFPQPEIVSLVQSYYFISQLYNLVLTLSNLYKKQESQIMVIKELYVQVCKLILIIIQLIPQSIQFIIDIGFIQLFLTNTLDQQANYFVFDIIKLLLQQNKQVEQILLMFLPTSFVQYIQKYPSNLISELFCSSFYLSIDCFFSANIKLQLQDILVSENMYINLDNYQNQDIFNNKFYAKKIVKQESVQKGIDKLYSIFEILDCKLNIYLPLIDFQQYSKYYLQLSQEFLSEQQLQQQFDIMIAKFKSEITILQIKQLLQNLLNFDQEKQFINLIYLKQFQIGQPYYHKFLQCIIQVFISQLEMFTLNIQQTVEKYEKNILILNEYQEKTGGSGLLLLTNGILKTDPSQLLEDIHVDIYLMFQVMEIVIQISIQLIILFKQFSFENISNIDHLRESIELFVYLQKVSFQDNVKDFRNFNTLMNMEQFDDLVDQYGKIYLQYQEVICQVQLSFIQNYSLNTKQLDQIILNCNQLLLNEFLLINDFLFEQCDYQHLISDIIITLDQIYEKPSQQLTVIQKQYISQILILVDYLSQEISIVQLIINSKFFIYLILLCYQGIQQAGTILLHFQQFFNLIEMDVFLQQVSYLGYQLGYQKDVTQFLLEIKKEIFTEHIVYTKLVQQQLVQDFNIQLRDQQYQFTNFEFLYQKSIPQHFYQDGIFFTSMLAIVYNQIDQDKINFSADIYQVSNNFELYENILRIYTRNYLQEYDNQFESKDFYEQYQNKAEDFIMKQNLVLTTLFSIVYKDKNLINLLQQNNDFVLHLLILTIQISQSQVTEMLSEQAALLLTLFNYLPQFSIFVNQFQLILLDKIKIFQYGTQCLLCDSSSEQIQQNFKIAQFNIKNIRQLNYTNGWSRKCFIQLLLREIVNNTSQYYYNDITQLYLMLSGIFFNIDLSYTSKNNQLITLSIIQLQEMMSKSIILQQLLPFPLQLQILSGQFTSIIQMLEDDNMNPSFVWNKNCTLQMIDFLQKTIENFILPYLLGQEINEDIPNFNYYEVIDYIYTFYTSKNIFINGVFINIYNEQSLLRLTNIPNPSLLIQTLIERITETTFTLNSQDLIVSHITTLFNVIQQERLFTYVLVDNSQFNQLIQQLYIQNQWLLQFSNEQKLLIFQQLTKILEIILQFRFDFSKKLSAPILKDLYLIIQQYEDYPPDYIFQISVLFSLLMQSSLNRQYFQRQMFNEKYGPISLYYLFINQQLNSQTRIFIASALGEILLSSQDAVDELASELKEGGYILLRTTLVELEIGFVGDSVPIPKIPLNQILLQQLPKKVEYHYQDIDGQNALSGWDECRGTEISQNYIRLNAVKSGHIQDLQLDQFLEISILGQLLQFLKSRE